MHLSCLIFASRRVMRWNYLSAYFGKNKTQYGTCVYLWIKMHIEMQICTYFI